MGDDLLRPTLPSDAPEPVTNIALACFDPEPENRPSFALIVHHMRAVSDVGWSEASLQLGSPACSRPQSASPLNAATGVLDSIAWQACLLRDNMQSSVQPALCRQSAGTGKDSCDVCRCVQALRPRSRNRPRVRAASADSSSRAAQQYHQQLQARR